MNLTVLAGPNGAGKTTCSEILLRQGLLPCPPINLDDLDELIDDSKIPHDFLRYESEKERQLIKLFYEFAEESIEKKKDFVYECNLSYKDQLYPIALFDNAGYQLNLVFLCLPSIQDSIIRVRKRVENGGHNVRLEKLTDNFTMGLQNLDKSYMEWDKLTILEALPIDGNIQKSMVFQRGNLLEYFSTPTCFNSELTPFLLQKIEKL